MHILVNLNRLVTPRALRNILLLPVILVSLLMTACSNSSSDAAAINAEFSALGIKGTISGQNINLDLSSLGNCATNIENMVIGVNAYGASISPDPRIARDYSKPVDFTLTAPDGTKAVYTVTVKGADCISAPVPAPTPTPTPTPTACTAAPTGSTGYSLVFKGCDANNVATYYDKTECVRDNATGLIWEGKTDDGGLRDKDNSYTNYDDPESFQITGDGLRKPTQTQIDSASNSVGFTQAVNATNLCGFANWRLPTKSELSSIATTTYPFINEAWFSVSTSGTGSNYWTSSHYSTDPNDDTANWAVTFSSGLVNGWYRWYEHKVRLVRN
jgi:Protein of unknown function (DUF1566)